MRRLLVLLSIVLVSACAGSADGDNNSISSEGQGTLEYPVVAKQNNINSRLPRGGTYWYIEIEGTPLLCIYIHGTTTCNWEDFNTTKAAKKAAG